jgi:hypothetical protein
MPLPAKGTDTSVNPGEVWESGRSVRSSDPCGPLRSVAVRPGSRIRTTGPADTPQPTRRQRVLRAASHLAAGSLRHSAHRNDASSNSGLIRRRHDLHGDVSPFFRPLYLLT